MGFRTLLVMKTLNDGLFTSHRNKMIKNNRLKLADAAVTFSIPVDFIQEKDRLDLVEFKSLKERFLTSALCRSRGSQRHLKGRQKTEQKGKKWGKKKSEIHH